MSDRNWETMTEAQRHALWGTANRRERAEECMKTAETVLATITTAVDALERERRGMDFTATDRAGDDDDDVVTPTTVTVTPVTVTWTADEQRTYLERVFQTEFTFLTDYDQAESFQLDLARREYDNDDDWWGRSGASFKASVMGSLFTERGGPEFQALIALYRLETHRRHGVALAPDGWVMEWDDPRTSAGRLARHEQQERDEEKRLEEQQREDEREAWERFKQEKMREGAATRQAERAARRAEFEATWQRETQGTTD